MRIAAYGRNAALSIPVCISLTESEYGPKEYMLDKPQPEQYVSEGVVLLKADYLSRFAEGRGRVY